MAAPSRLLSVATLAALLALTLWAAVRASASGSGLDQVISYPGAAVGLVGGGLAGWALSRATPRTRTTIAVALTVALVVWTSGLLPLRLPYVYANALAATAIQVSALCAVLRWRAESRHHIVLACASAAAYGVAVIERSAVAVVVGLPVVVAAVLLPTVRWRRRPRLLGLLAFGAVGAWSGWVLAAARDLPWTRRLPFPDSTRGYLWEWALRIWQEDPWVGQGPGAIGRLVPLASDPDTAAAHSALLQVGAETGAIGVALLGLIVALGVWWSVKGPTGPAIIATVAWVAITEHAFVDHIVDFAPALTVAATVIVMAARSGSGSEELDVAEGQYPVRAARWRGGERPRDEQRSHPGNR